MTIIATARVPRIFDLRFSPTGNFPRLFPHPRTAEAEMLAPMPAPVVEPVSGPPARRSSTCRPWCADADASNVWHGTDECMAEPISLPATAGQYEVSDHGAVFPMLTTYTVIPEPGAQASVRVEIGGPSPFTSGGDMNGWLDMTPSEARALAARLLASAEAAEQDRRTA